MILCDREWWQWENVCQSFFEELKHGNEASVAFMLIWSIEIDEIMIEELIIKWRQTAIVNHAATMLISTCEKHENTLIITEMVCRPKCLIIISEGLSNLVNEISIMAPSFVYRMTTYNL